LSDQIINFSGKRYVERLIANAEVVTVLSSTQHPPSRNLWAEDETVLTEALFENPNKSPITLFKNPNKSPINFFLLFLSGKMTRQISLL
jgi:hypothetical protein